MPPYRIEWLDEAQADVRCPDRPTAMRIFDGVLHYARTGGGDVEPLYGNLAGGSACGSADIASCSVFMRALCASLMCGYGLRLTGDLQATYGPAEGLITAS